MTETPTFAERVDRHGNANVLNEAEQEAIDYYIEGGGREKRRDYKGTERRSIGSQLDRQMPALLGMKFSSDGPSDAEKLIKHFQSYAPMSFQEGMTLKDGVEQRLTNIIRMPEEKAESAIKGQYNTYVKFLSDAAQDKHVLDSVLVEKENGPPQPNIDLVRTSPLVQEAIAKQLMARGFLWEKFKKTWPNSKTNFYKERHKYWFGFTLAASRFASDESLKLLYEFASKRTNLRYKDLFAHMSEVEALPVVQRLKNQGKIAPINFSKLWQYKVDAEESQEISHEETSTGSWRDLTVPKSIGHLLTEEVVAGVSAEGTEKPLSEEGQRQSKDEIMTEHEAIEIEKAELRGKLADRNWQPGWIEREIKKRYPSSPDPEQEQKKEDAKARFIGGLGKPKKTKGGYKRGWRETGPSDKRKETD